MPRRFRCRVFIPGLVQPESCDRCAAGHTTLGVGLRFHFASPRKRRSRSALAEKSADGKGSNL